MWSSISSSLILRSTRSSLMVCSFPIAVLGLGGRSWCGPRWRGPPQERRNVRHLAGIGRRDLVAPRRPAVARLTRKHFEKRTAIESLDPPVNLVWLFGMLADRCDDHLMHVGCEPTRIALGGEQHGLNVRAGRVAHAPMQALAVERDTLGLGRRFQPIEADGFELESTGFD